MNKREARIDAMRRASAGLISLADELCYEVEEQDADRELMKVANALYALSREMEARASRMQDSGASVRLAYRPKKAREQE